MRQKSHVKGPGEESVKTVLICDGLMTRASSSLSLVSLEIVPSRAHLTSNTARTPTPKHSRSNEMRVRAIAHQHGAVLRSFVYVGR